MLISLTILLYKGLIILKLLNIVLRIKKFQYDGLYESAIKLIKGTILTTRLTRLLYYLIILLLQSCYYNNNLILLAKNVILNLILSIENQYYLCKFYLAYASVMFRYNQPATFSACSISLLLYNKSKLIYQLNLIKNNLIFSNDRLLYSKIIINILIISNIQMLLLLQYKLLLIIDYSLRFLFPNKKYFYIVVLNKKYTINYNICTFILNLLYLLKYINLSSNVLFTQYYLNLFIVALSHIISDAINFNVTLFYILLKIYTISLVISIISKKILSINFDLLSYSNKQNYLISINKIASVFTTLLINIYYATNVIRYSGLYFYFKLNFLMYKLNKYSILLKLLKFSTILRKVFQIDVILFQYKFNNIDDLLKILIILLYVYIFSVCLYYYNIFYSLFSKVRTILEDLLNKLTYLFMVTFNLIYNNFFLFLLDLHIFNKVSVLRVNMIRFMGRLSKHVAFQLSLAYKTILYLMSLYYLFNLKFHLYILIKAVIDSMLRLLLMLKYFTLYLNINYQYKISLSDIKRMLLLKQSNTMLLNFTHILAHDIKTPLRTISSYAQLLKYEKELLYIDIIILSSKSLYNMVLSSLKYVSVDKLINKIKFNLYLLLMLVIRNCSSLISKANIIVDVKNLDTFPLLYADKLLIKTVIHNLLTNSIKACNKLNSRILFGCLNLNWFYIKDNGRGIKSQNKQKIFNLFYRQHKKDLLGNLILGSGFGLAIVKRILLKHLSIIRVLSQLNLGTMIMFSLNSMKGK